MSDIQNNQRTRIKATEQMIHNSRDREQFQKNDQIEGGRKLPRGGKKSSY